MLGYNPLSAAPISALAPLLFTLGADTGAFTLTGQAAGQRVSMRASAGSFALTGQDATLARSLIMVSGTGAFVLAGQDATVASTRTMPGDTGAYTLTGQAVGFQRKMRGSAGSFLLTGQSALLSYQRSVVGDTGAFTLTGQSATLIRAKVLIADRGTFSLTGRPATLSRALGQLGQNVVNTLTAPVNFKGELDANTIRTNDNIVAQAFNAHDSDASIHFQSGLLSRRPVAPVEGAKWVATDTQDTYLYTGGQWVQIGWAHWYGDFFDTTDQTISTINTEQLVTINSTGTTRGISVVSGSQVRVSYAGDYNVMFSAQLKNTDSAEHDVAFWWKKNGTNISDSAGKVTLPKKHGSDDGHIIAMWNVFVSMAAGDYLQLYWQGPSTLLSLETIPAAGSVPRIPSVIVTINRI